MGGKLLRQKAPQQAMALSSHQLGSWSGGEGEREGGGGGEILVKVGRNYSLSRVILCRNTLIEAYVTLS